MKTHTNFQVFKSRNIAYCSYSKETSNLTLCYDFTLNQNCSCLRNVTKDIVCREDLYENITEALSWVLLFMILLLAAELVAIRFKRSYLDNTFGSLLFSIGIICSVITQLCSRHFFNHNNKIIFWHCTVQNLVSMFATVFGYLFLFEKSTRVNFGLRNRGMGLVIAVVTLCCCVGDIVSFCSAIKTKDGAFASSYIMFIAQKLVQSVMYKSIRQCIPRMSDFKYGTSFYFKFLALIDFNLFLNGFPPANVPLHMLIPIESTIAIVQYILQALIIYYQFLFTVCFLKHACDVLEDNDWPHITKVDDEDFEDSPKRPHYIIAALLFSVICVTMETLPAVQSWYKILPVYLNILPICVDVILVFLSIMLLLKMDIPVHQNKKPDYITTAFSNLGAVCVFWYISSGIMLSACLKYKVASSNFGWSVAVNFANGLTMLFVILLFTGVTAETMELAQNHKLKNNFLVPATCGLLIAKFVASIVQKFDPMLLHCVSRHLIRQDSLGLHYFFAVGQIFTIIAYTHFSLHFILMALRLYEKPKIESEYNYIVALTGNGESTTNISVTYPQIEKTKYNT